MAEWIFCVHGINTQVEYPDRLHSIRRQTNKGTVIRQNAEGNWFHLAIPTPTQLRSDRVEGLRAFFRGKINGQATVTKVHVRHGLDRVYSSGDISLTGRDLSENYSLSEMRCTRPLAISVYVDFEDGGRIEFHDAGAKFKDTT